MRALLVVTLAVGSLLAPATPAPAAGPIGIVSPDPTASNVSAYGGALVWSRRAPSGDYRLVVTKSGVASDAPVARFRHPVDADLGPGRHGGIVAVYARCRSSRRCNLFTLNLGSGRERKLRSLAGGRPEFVPSAWRGRYAFGRAARITGEGTSFRDVRPFRSGGLFKTDRRVRLSRRLPFGTDLRRTRVAYITDPQQLSSVRTQLFHRRRPGRDCRLAFFDNRDSGSSGEHLFSPVIYGDFIYWLDETNLSVDPTQSFDLSRRRLPSRRCRQRSAVQLSHLVAVRKDDPAPRPESIAIDRGHVYFTGPRGVRQAELSSLAFGSR